MIIVLTGILWLLYAATRLNDLEVQGEPTGRIDNPCEQSLSGNQPQLLPCNYIIGLVPQWYRPKSTPTAYEPVSRSRPKGLPWNALRSIEDLWQINVSETVWVDDYLDRFPVSEGESYGQLVQPVASTNSRRETGGPQAFLAHHANMDVQKLLVPGESGNKIHTRHLAMRCLLLCMLMFYLETCWAPRQAKSKNCFILFAIFWSSNRTPYGFDSLRQKNFTPQSYIEIVISRSILSSER